MGGLNRVWLSSQPIKRFIPMDTGTVAYEIPRDVVAEAVVDAATQLSG